MSGPYQHHRGGFPPVAVQNAVRKARAMVNASGEMMHAGRRRKLPRQPPRQRARMPIPFNAPGGLRKETVIIHLYI